MKGFLQDEMNLSLAATVSQNKEISFFDFKICCSSKAASLMPIEEGRIGWRLKKESKMNLEQDKNLHWQDHSGLK
jgi:hypothetical protein